MMPFSHVKTVSALFRAQPESVAHILSGSYPEVPAGGRRHMSII